MKIKPLYDHVVVHRETEVQAGLIQLHDAAKKKLNSGKVLAVGVGKLNGSGAVHDMLIKVGDSVVFNKYAGAEHPCLGRDVVVMRECDILGVIIE